jgi:Uma2 family endonuclease
MSKSKVNEAPAPYSRDRLITADEFSRHPEWGYCELKRGRVVPMPPPKYRHGILVARMAFFLQQYLSKSSSGVVMTESGVQTESDPDTVRGPDASYMSAERYSQVRTQDRYPTLMPEICVEVMSPSDTWPRLKEKVNEYLAAGALLVWVIDGEGRKVHVFAKAAAEQVLGESDLLDGGQALPGFTLSLKEFFSILD